MLEILKREVFEANIELVEKGMVIYTWGNVSGIDREKGLVVIKPSGVDYEGMKAEDMVVVDLDGNVVEGNYKPSSDTATHLELYKKYPEIGGVVHTHSTWAVTFAQAGMSIPAFGTTHADYFYGDIPCTRELTEEEISENYELNTGKVILETIGDNDPMAIPGIVVKNHGPFAWGRSAAGSVYNAVVMDKVAEMAYKTMTLNPRAQRVSQYLLDKHYLRKHGANAYYGQSPSSEDK
ncbi:MAG TPA: L-ribulose-5-phosphate 4-epimerase [Clostridiales bacterium]|nr:L-ribulose-5-phosphate 4-epimerase [Clostridiales bacterium]